MEMHLSRRARAILGLVAVGAGIPVVAVASVHLADAVGGLPVSVPTLSTSSGTAGTAGTAGSAATTNGTTSPQTASGSSSTSQGIPADKVTVAGSRVVVMGPQDDKVLLSAQMKTSNVADLVFSITAECSVFTSVTTMGNDSQEATAQVVMWITVDGQPVGVEPASPGASLDSSQVTFCNRDYKMVTSGFATPSPGASPSPSITNWEKTLDANGFNWVALNVGNQVHTIQLHAMLTENVSDPNKDQAQAYVAARTMVVNVTQSAQNQAQ